VLRELILGRRRYDIPHGPVQRVSGLTGRRRLEYIRRPQHTRTTETYWSARGQSEWVVASSNLKLLFHSNPTIAPPAASAQEERYPPSLRKPVNQSMSQPPAPKRTPEATDTQYNLHINAVEMTPARPRRSAASLKIVGLTSTRNEP
jgi:hypothetical protein